MQGPQIGGTSAAIAAACGIDATPLADLNDIDYGDWQFRAHEDVERMDAKLFAAWFATPHLVRFPNGESLQDLVARAANALRFVLAQHPSGPILTFASHCGGYSCEC
jgi:phosphoserine phosphatase